MKFETDILFTFASAAIGITVVLLLGIGIYFLLRRGLLVMLENEYVTPPLYSVLKSIAKWGIVLIVAVIALQQVGIRITNIIAGILTIAGMIAIGFIAVWSILSNVLCSILLIASHAFEIGDEIEIIEPVGGDGLRGTVTDFNVMFTTIVEKDDEGVSPFITQIPNNIFFQKTLRRKAAPDAITLGRHLFSRPLIGGNSK